MSGTIGTPQIIAALEITSSNKEGLQFLTALTEAILRSPQLVTLELLQALYIFTTRKSYQPARARAAKALAAALSVGRSDDAKTFVADILASEVGTKNESADRLSDFARRKAFICVLAIADRDPAPLARPALAASLISFASDFEPQRHFVYRALKTIIACHPSLAAVVSHERDRQLGRRTAANFAFFDRLTKIATDNPDGRGARAHALLNLTAELTRLTAP